MMLNHKLFFYFLMKLTLKLCVKKDVYKIGSYNSWSFSKKLIYYTWIQQKMAALQKHLSKMLQGFSK